MSEEKKEKEKSAEPVVRILKEAGTTTESNFLR